MFNNQSDYPEPQEFRPERYLTPEGLLRTDNNFRDPIDIAFGFGRRLEASCTIRRVASINFETRACPGTHIALSTILLTVASILTVFNIGKDIDADGRPIEPGREYSSTAVS